MMEEKIKRVQQAILEVEAHAHQLHLNLLCAEAQVDALKKELVSLENKQKDF